ncbi:MAG: hypothetical protein ACFB9M_19735 [Myxococcota bacterium]
MKVDARTQVRFAAALVAWTSGAASILLLDDPRLRFGSFLAWMTLSVMGWLTMPSLAGWRLRLVIVIGAALRVACVASAPAFSEDVFRHVFEGRVVWEKGPLFPFLVPPAQAPAASVSDDLLDDAWLRINHPELPTIYPPVTLVTFAMAGALADAVGLAPLSVLKTFLVVAEALACVLIAKSLGRSAVAFLWMCPLAMFEIGREGHAEALSLLGFALAICGWRSVRPRWGHGGFAVAASTKLHGVLGLVVGARTTRSGVLPALLLMATAAVPAIILGTRGIESLSAYAQRWQSGDGAFGLILWVVRSSLDADWVRVAGVTLTAQQLARITVAAMLFLIVALTLRRRPSPKAVPVLTGRLLLIAVLLSPTLHPWYTLWLLPFAALEGLATGRWGFKSAMTLLIAGSPVLHYPGFLELTQGRWEEWVLPRALLHGAAWLLLWAPWRMLVRPSSGAGATSR